MRIIPFLLLSFLSFRVEAGNLYKNDSVAICRTVTDFFQWYIRVVKQKQRAEYQPQFIANPQGMTTLNFNQYFKNLRKHGFSDSLIAKERRSYQSCLDHITKIKFSEFKISKKDLGDFEEMDCDFSNYYRWTGGQEPIDDIQIGSVYIMNSTSAYVQIENVDFDPIENKKRLWGSKLVRLTRIHNRWRIAYITFRFRK
jgi:hypothetical protein